MQDFRKLKIWNEGKSLAVITYKITDKFPKREAFGITDQMRRASTSVPSNIAEGSGKNTNKSFIAFIHNSLGSLSELESFTEIAFELDYLNQENRDELIEKVDHVRRMSINFIKKLKA